MQITNDTLDLCTQSIRSRELDDLRRIRPATWLGPPMRLLFVSGVSVGGAARSTLELATQLARRGHEVQVLVTNRPSDSSVFGLLIRAYVKLEEHVTLRRVARMPLRWFGRRAHVVSAPSPGLRILEGTVAENSFKTIVRDFHPELVIVNSVPRVALRLMWAAKASDMPLALYMRESHSLTHLTQSNVRPDLLLANAMEFCTQAEQLGFECVFVPSVIDLDAASVATSRETILLVNPVAENRPDLVARLAAERPDLRFVLQESWPMSQDEVAGLEALIGESRNIELRRHNPDPAQIYRDARVLLATYPGGRPRVVVEAQYNGIPVVSVDQPALSEAVGGGGILIPADAPDSAWLEALAELDDEVEYLRLSAHAFDQAHRPEISPARIVDDFEAVARELIAGTDGQR